MAGYEYNPLLKLDLQKKSAVSPSDIQHLEQEIASINEDITDINGDLKNKVPKFFTSIEELEVGEIGQYQGETNETFTRGFFYERGSGTPAQYEDITIQSGSKKIIYTNKFDSSQRVVYAFDTIQLPSSVVVNYAQGGPVYLLDDVFYDKLKNTANTIWILNETSLVPTSIDDTTYIYSLYETLRTLVTGQLLTDIQDLYNIIKSSILNAGFRTALTSPASLGRITDLMMIIYIPLKFDNGHGTISTYDVTRYILISDLAALNWNEVEYISQYYSIEELQLEWCYDRSRPIAYQYSYIVVTIANTRYVFGVDRSSGQTATELYQTVSEDGEQSRYIDINHKLCVFDSEPTSEGSYWAQNLDVDIYFNYNYTIQDTTEAITIHRKIQQYDEYGFPISEQPTIIRRDTQPSLNPSDFATSEQGAKADTALQGIAKGTDGNYITTTVTAKDANNQQTVAASLTIQDIATADSTHKGLAEASNVKAYAATAAQGAKADTALQSIDKGTDGDYITTTVTAKDANNQQTVSASLTIQDIANADSTHKGLAEASNVKAYSATAAQGAKADSALQQVVHGTDGLYVTTTVTQKANNEQTISTALTLQDIATADAQHQGVAEASDVRNYLNIIAATSEAYGVMWDTANPSPTLTRIGNMTNHALLPVQSQMIGGVMADDGTFTPFDNQTDWTQATQARDGSDGQVMVRLPKHWRRCSTFGTYNIVMLSPVEIPGYVEVKEQYVSAYEASLQRSTLKLSSVNNATADYRGGQNEASWDGTYRTLLNRPVSELDLTQFRTYARNRNTNNTKWNCLTYEAVRTIFWLFVAEYATLNSQADFNSALDANGFKQGGLGIGVSDWTGDAWNAYNGYAPFVPCGVLDEYGNGTAEKNYSIYNADSSLAHTFKVNKYRGIELPFANLWKHVDGVLINVESGNGVSTAYATIDTANFSSTSIADYAAICDTARVDSFIKDICFNANGDIFAVAGGGDSSSYYCDMYWGSNIPATGSQLRAWVFGGAANYGGTCGLACSYSYYVPGARSRSLGSRLCFVP